MGKPTCLFGLVYLVGVRRLHCIMLSDASVP